MSVTLLLGLGGIGGETVAQIYHKTPSPSSVAAIQIDTESSHTPIDGVTQLNLGWRERISERIAAHPSLHAEEWLPTDPTFRHTFADSGSGMNRSLGRFALATAWEKDSLRPLWESIDTLLSRGDRQADVVIVTTTAGSAGSGMFLQIAALVRRMLSQYGCTATVHGFFLLPEPLTPLLADNRWALERLFANSYASLCELAFFQAERAAARHGQATGRGLGLDGFCRSDDPAAPPLFDFVTMIGDGTPRMNRSQLIDTAVTAIHGKFLTAAANELRLFDMTWAANNGFYVGSLGAATLCHPREERIAFLTGEALRPLLLPAEEIPESERMAAGFLSRETVREKAASDLDGYAQLLSESLNALMTEHFGASMLPDTDRDALRHAIRQEEKRMEEGVCLLPGQATALGHALADQLLPRDGGALRRQDPLSPFSLFRLPGYADRETLRRYWQDMIDAISRWKECETVIPDKNPVPPLPFGLTRERGEEYDNILLRKSVLVSEKRFLRDMAAWYRLRMTAQRKTLLDTLHRKACRAFADAYAERLQRCLFALKTMTDQLLPRCLRVVTLRPASELGGPCDTVTPPLSDLPLALGPIASALTEALFLAIATGEYQITVPEAIETARGAIAEQIRHHYAKQAGHNLFEALIACSDAEAPAEESASERQTRRIAYVHTRLKALTERAKPALTVRVEEDIRQSVVYRLPPCTLQYRQSLQLDAVFGPHLLAGIDNTCPNDELLCLRPLTVIRPGLSALPLMDRLPERPLFRSYTALLSEPEARRRTPHIDRRWDTVFGTP